MEEIPSNLVSIVETGHEELTRPQHRRFDEKNSGVIRRLLGRNDESCESTGNPLSFVSLVLGSIGWLSSVWVPFKVSLSVASCDIEMCTLDTPV